MTPRTRVSVRDVLYGEEDGLAQGTTNVDVVGSGEDTVGPQSEDHVNVVGFRAEKPFTIGRFGVLHACLDVFNAFNVNTVAS